MVNKKKVERFNTTNQQLKSKKILKTIENQRQKTVVQIYFYLYTILLSFICFF